MGDVRLAWHGFKRGCVAIFLLGSCAQVGTPPGGPKDVTPPVLVEAFPRVGATGVKPDKLILTFDEFVQAKQWRSQLLISPPLQGAVEVIERGKTVEVSWESPLEDRTTYVFQFGDGIVDLTEGNPASSLIHAFATGDQLDTLSLQGRVTGAVDGKPRSNWRVLVFDESWSPDSLKSGALPSYVGMTNDQGEFSVNHLPERAFWMYALDDKNRNYQWEPGEDMALVPQQVRAGIDTMLVLRAGQTKAKMLAYLSDGQRDSTGFARWKLSVEPQVGDQFRWLLVDSLSREQGGQQIQQGPEGFDEAADRDAARGRVMEFDGTTVMIHDWDVDWDGMAWRIAWEHATRWPGDDLVVDTLDVPVPRLSKTADGELRSKPMGQHFPDKPALVGWSVPLTSIDSTRWSVWADSVVFDVRLGWNEASRNVYVEPSRGGWPQGASIRCLLAPGALTWRGGVLTDSLELAWDIQSPEALSEWVLVLSGIECPGFLETVDAKEERMELIRVSSDTILQFKGLLPGRYRAMWWGDPNEDMTWSDVDPQAWSEPEPAAGMELVDLRPNWLVESSWDLDSAVCKVSR